MFTFCNSNGYMLVDVKKIKNKGVLKMTKKEMFLKLQGIEFVLFSLTAKDQLRAGELEIAHKHSKEILTSLKNQLEEGIK